MRFARFSHPARPRSRRTYGPRRLRWQSEPAHGLTLPWIAQSTRFQSGALSLCACSARSTTRSTFCLVLPARTLTVDPSYPARPFQDVAGLTTGTRLRIWRPVPGLDVPAWAGCPAWAYSTHSPSRRCSPARREGGADLVVVRSHQRRSSGDGDRPARVTRL